MSRYLGWYHMAQVLIAAAGYYLLLHPETHICRVTQTFLTVYWTTNTLKTGKKSTEDLGSSGTVRTGGQFEPLLCWAVPEFHKIDGAWPKPGVSSIVVRSDLSLPSRSGHSLLIHRTVQCNRSGHVMAVSRRGDEGRWRESTKFPLWVELIVNGKVPELFLASACRHSYRLRLCLHAYAKIRPCGG